MPESNLLNLSGYEFKKDIEQMNQSLAPYLSSDGKYVGGRGKWNKSGETYIVHYISKFDGSWSAYTLEEMIKVAYDDEIRTREAFTYSTGNSAITALLILENSGEADFEWYKQGYKNPELLKNFKIGSKWEPTKAHI